MDVSSQPSDYGSPWQADQRSNGTEIHDLLPDVQIDTAAEKNHGDRVSTRNIAAYFSYSTREDDQDRPKAEAELAADLEKWRNELLLPDPTACPLPHLLMLHMLYHLTVIFLHRPSYRKPSTITPTAAERCDAAAHSTLQLLRTFDETHGVRHGPMTLSGSGRVFALTASPIHSRCRDCLCSESPQLTDESRIPGERLSEAARLRESVVMRSADIQIGFMSRIGELYPCTLLMFSLYMERRHSRSRCAHQPLQRMATRCSIQWLHPSSRDHAAVARIGQGQSSGSQRVAHESRAVGFVLESHDERDGNGRRVVDVEVLYKVPVN